MSRTLALIAAVACLGARCGEVPPPVEGPTGIEDALSRLATRAGTTANLRGFASVTGWDAKQTFKGKLLVVAERPGRVHIEVLSPFDQPISYLATDGKRLDLYLLDEGRYFTGAATAENIAKLLPMRIDPTVFVEALLGGPPLPRPADSKPRLRWDGDAGVYELRYQDPGPVAWLRPKDLAPVQAGWLGPGEKTGWALELWEYEGGAPRRLAFEHRVSGSGFRLHWDQLETNVGDLPAETWRIEPPRGVDVETLDAPAHTR